MKDTRELRMFLLKQMDDAANGKLKSDNAKAVCNLAQQVYNTLNIEVRQAQLKAKMEGGEIAPVRFDQ